MKQILQSYRSGELWLADVPAPALRDGGAVVRTAASVVSAGTERMILELARKSLVGKLRARPDLVRKVIAKIKTEGLSQTLSKAFAKLDEPIPLGYCCAGVVAEIGAGVSGLRVGDRVACAGTGYATHAEFNYVPQNLLVKVPDAVSLEDAAITTLGAIALQGVRQADVRIGERIVVLGLGLLGLLTVQVLKAAGCAVLGSDPDVQRCELARQLGADGAVSSDLVGAAAMFSDGRGADGVIITAATSSNQPIEDAAEMCRQKGRVVVVGVVSMNIPREPFYKKELDLRLSMSYGPGRYDPDYEEAGHDYPFGYVRWTQQRNMQAFVELLAAGKVTPGKLVTHRFSVDDALRAYEMLESGTQKYLGIVIQYVPAEAAAPVPRTVEFRAIQKTDRIGVGFIGAGNFAKGVLIPTLVKIGGVELIGLCTATGMSAAQTARKHGFAYATTDHRRLLSDERINTIFIAARHDTHAMFACEALRAGKHVFVEKPLCIKSDQIEQYQQALSASPQRCLMIGFNRRFSPHATAIREAFASRRSPMVINYRIIAGHVPRDSWLQDKQSGGGRIIGEVCHFIDLCEYLIGSQPSHVRADCIASADARLVPEDSMVATIRYADSSLAAIQYVAQGASEIGKERLEVFADGATAILDDFVRTSFYGMRARAVKGSQDKGFAGELNAFLESIRLGGQSPIAFDSIVRTTQTTFAIVESLRAGGGAQSLPPSKYVAPCGM